MRRVQGVQRAARTGRSSDAEARRHSSNEKSRRLRRHRCSSRRRRPLSGGACRASRAWRRACRSASPRARCATRSRRSSARADLERLLPLHRRLRRNAGEQTGAGSRIAGPRSCTACRRPSASRSKTRAGASSRPKPPACAASASRRPIRSRICPDADAIVDSLDEFTPTVIAALARGSCSRLARPRTLPARCTTARAVHVTIAAVKSAFHLHSRSVQVAAELENGHERAGRRPGAGGAGDRPGRIPVARCRRRTWSARSHGRRSRRARGTGRRARPGRHRCAQRVPLRRAGLHRQPRALRRSAQQLPQRSARIAAPAFRSAWPSSTSKSRAAPACTSRA